jgi:hypothetical protein
VSTRPSVLDRLLPPAANDYRGSRWVVVAMSVYTVVLTARSLVHMFAADGGAESIATIDIGVEGGDNIVALFAQWGALQLLLAGIVWVVIWRLRSLVPFMALVLLLEPILRAAMGAIKPVETVGTAPGAALNNVGIILLAALFVFSITTIRDGPAAVTTDEPSSPGVSDRRGPPESIDVSEM